MNASDAEMVIESEVIKLLEGCLSVAHREISGSSRLVEDLSADSVDIVEVAIAVDEAFNIELSSHQIAEWKTVVDVVASVVEARAQ